MSTAEAVIPYPADEVVAASILLTQLPGGAGFMVRYHVPGREALAAEGRVGPIAGAFAIGEDEALDLAVAMIRCDRAALRRRVAEDGEDLARHGV